MLNMPVIINKDRVHLVDSAVGRTVLVVRDRSGSRRWVSRELGSAGFRVVEADSDQDGWVSFRHVEPDLVVADVRQPGARNLELLQRIRDVSNVPVILCAKGGDVASAVAAIKAGAQEFLTPPEDRARLRESAMALTRGGSWEGGLEGTSAIIGAGAAADRLRDRVSALAPLRIPVLVSGEPGVGHDHVVRCLHALDTSAQSDLVVVSSGSPIARRAPPAGVTCYLDEVGRFSLSEQAHWFESLCRVEGSGAGFRLVASTTEDIAAFVRREAFHRGLAEKLLRFEVRIAPLRERREDIAPLAVHLAGKIGDAMGRERVRIESEALALLRAASWPGNVRELAETVEKLVAYSPGGVITRERVREVFGDAPDDVASLRRRRSEEQREELLALLEACGGNLAEVARRLKISRGAVIYRARKHGLLARRRDL